MKILKKLFKKLPSTYHYNILEYDDYDGDAAICIITNKLLYIVDLDWENGVMDIEFGVNGSEFHDTTNLNIQYKLLNTVSHITKVIAKKSGMRFHSVVFKSSNWRNGKQDERSADIRNRFFSRYVLKTYPSATVETGENNSIIIRLNDV
jgi:hypothetical protein